MLDEYSSKVLRAAIELVEVAKQRNIIVRILGALAAYLHCSEDEDTLKFFKNSGRLDTGSIFTDIDLMAYSKQRKQIINLMKELGYSEDRIINALFGHKRLIYFKDQVKVDIFFDKLEFSHDVNFGTEPGKGRLELDYPTITLTDLMLEKLQIHQINKKDIIDMMAVLMTHEVSDSSEREVIDRRYIASVLADDWGFWYDALENLKKVEFFTMKFKDENLIKIEQAEKIVKNVNKIREAVESCEKTKNWLKRSKIGTSKPWYREVGDIG